MALGLVVLAAGPFVLASAAALGGPPAPPAVEAAGSPEWAARALAATVGTAPSEVTAALFADDAVIAEWMPSGQYWEASDAPQRRAWIEEQLVVGTRLSADHLRVRGTDVAWRAWLLRDEGIASGSGPEERASVAAMDEAGLIRSWTLFPLEDCAGPDAMRWPCSDLEYP